MQLKDIEALAKLARINLEESEKEVYLKEMDSILSYVDKIQEVATGNTEPEIGLVYNVFRKDEVLDKSGESIKIKEQFPECEGDFLKVKSILNN